MLDYSEILPKKVILMDGAPYEVLDAHVFRKQMRKPVNQTKLRNLISGKVTEQSFHQAEKVEEAEITTRMARFLYQNRGEWWFADEKNAADRFVLSADVAGEQAKFIKANSVVEVIEFDEKPIGLRVPIKVELAVKEAAPAVRGNTAQGATKQIILETGAVIYGPLFINEGDILRINTESGEYVERVEKK